ncbi:MAG: (d)CMP kinase [Leptospira sp.]|nr:(d)CMP kinase [Leptospira sp.]
MIDRKDKYVIAIDGPAGSGKSTVARQVAKHLGIDYLDSGAYYRTLTLHLFREFSNLSENQSFADWTTRNQDNLNLKDIRIDLEFGEGGENRIFLNEDNVSAEIRTPEVTEKIKYVADKQAFRDFVNHHIRKLAEKYSLVMDGRDIGTEVFPNTPFKFFLTASADVRAKRRFQEMQEKGISAEYERVLEEMKLRDESDENRKIAPLKKAKDAILVDTDGLSIKVVIETILSGLTDP